MAQSIVGERLRELKQQVREAWSKRKTPEGQRVMVGFFKSLDLLQRFDHHLSDREKASLQETTDKVFRSIGDIS